MHDDLIQRHAGLVSLSFVPEIRLHSTTDFSQLWQETAGHNVGDAPLPFWSVAWAGGQALARYVLDHPRVAVGRTVLDLGAGSGISGIAAAMAGAHSVSCVDTDERARVVIGLNAAANHVRVATGGDDLLDADPPAVDLVLVGDLFYERQLADRLLPWLRRAHAAGSDVLIGDPGRPYTPDGQLTKVASYDISGVGDVEGADTRTSCVFVFAGEPAITSP